MEIKNREIDSRFVIALHLLNAGINVVIGQQWSIFANVSSLPPGLILFKTVNDIQAKNMEAFYQHGHIVAATDEEVLLCAEEACFCCAFSKLAADNCHLFYAQSDQHKLAVESNFPGLRGKVVVTGNPRVDATRQSERAKFANEAAEIRKKIGPFILFNTNYAIVNSVWGDINAVLSLSVRAGTVDIKNEASINAFRAGAKWELNNRDEFLKLLQWSTDNINTHSIVIRPHPGEKEGYWEGLFAIHPNVKIIPRSYHMPWIMAADLLIHTSCTTGLEAALLNKAVLNLVPAPDPVWPRLTNTVNPCFSTWSDAAQVITSFITGKSSTLNETRVFQEELKRYFPNFQGSDSASNIAQASIEALSHHGATPDPSYRWNAIGKGFTGISRDSILTDKLSFTAAEAESHLKDLHQRIGLQRRVKIFEIDDSLFRLTPY